MLHGNKKVKPKYSIITPVYNGANTIGNCIAKILGQQYQNFELILVDDGSTDNTWHILEDYHRYDSRVKIYRQLNSGPSSARNEGLCRANGTHIIFVDADDSVDNTWLAAIDQAIDEHDLLVFNFFHCYEECQLQSSPSCRDLRDKDHFVMFLQQKEILGYLWNKVFKYQIIQENGMRFNDAYRFKEDEEFVYRYFLYTETFHFLDLGLYFYYAPGSTKYWRVSKFDCIIDIMRSINQLVIDQKIKSDILHKYKHMLTEELLRLYKQDSFKSSFKKLKSYRATEVALEDSFFLKQFRLEKVYFRKNINISHLFFYVWSRIFSNVTKESIYD